MIAAAKLVPAHADGVGHTAGELALTAITIAAMVVPLILIGVLAVIFYRAAKRDEHPHQGRT
jgi:hypothetical protein